PVGHPRDGPRGGGRRPLRRVGPRRPGGAGRADDAAAPGGAPDRVGEPTQGHARLRAAGAGDGGRAAVRRRPGGGPLPRRPRTSRGGRYVREVLTDIDRWLAAGKRVAVARVVEVEGSGPREPGATMAVSEDGEIAGSVSGGCVEGAVLTEALEVLGGDGTPRLVTYGISDDDAFAVGLTCGGTIHVLVEPLDWALFDALDESIRSEDPLALATMLEGPRPGANVLVRPGTDAAGTFGNAGLDRVVVR